SVGAPRRLRRRGTPTPRRARPERSPSDRRQASRQRTPPCRRSKKNISGTRGFRATGRRSRTGKRARARGSSPRSPVKQARQHAGGCESVRARRELNRSGLAEAPEDEMRSRDAARRGSERVRKIKHADRVSDVSGPADAVGDEQRQRRTHAHGRREQQRKGGQADLQSRRSRSDRSYPVKQIERASGLEVGLAALALLLAPT